METREIKFRAWDKTTNTMTISRSLLEWMDAFAQFEFDTKSNQLKRMEHFEFMQYTGLKDKNGKEIYEGDFVSLDSFSPNPYEVKFIEGAFCLWRDDVGYATDMHYIHHAGRPQSLIVGNVYENHNLLK